MSRSGLDLAIAAIAVTVPRPVPAFSEADGVELTRPGRTGPLGLSGGATGVVLTGGGAYLAQALTWSRRRQGRVAATWLVVLISSAVLLTPVLLAGLAARFLAGVLATPGFRWPWSAVAVLAVERLATRAMATRLLEDGERSAQKRADQELLAVASERIRFRGGLGRMRQEPSARSRSDPEAAARSCGSRWRHVASPSSFAPAAVAASGSLDCPCPWGWGFQGGFLTALNVHVHSCRFRPSEDPDPEASTEPPDRVRQPQGSEVPPSACGPAADSERRARSEAG